MNHLEKHQLIKKAGLFDNMSNVGSNMWEGLKTGMGAALSPVSGLLNMFGGNKSNQQNQQPFQGGGYNNSNPWMQRMDQAYMNDMRRGGYGGMQAGPYPYGGGYGGMQAGPYPYGGYGGGGYGGMQAGPYPYGGGRGGRGGRRRNKRQRALRQEWKQFNQDWKGRDNQPAEEAPQPVDPVTGSVGDTTEPAAPAPSAPQPAAPQPAAPQPAAPQPAAPQPAAPAPSAPQPAAPQFTPSATPQPIPEGPSIPGGMDNLASSARQAEANNVANTAQTNLMGNLQNDIRGVQQNLQGLGPAVENAGYDMNAPRADRMEGPLQGLAAAAKGSGYDMSAPRQSTPPSSIPQAPRQDFGFDSQSTTPSSMTTPPTQTAQPAQKDPYDIGAQIANINQQGANEMANYKPNIELPKIDLPQLPTAGLPGTKSPAGVAPTPQAPTAQAPVLSGQYKPFLNSGVGERTI